MDSSVGVDSGETVVLGVCGGTITHLLAVGVRNVDLRVEGGDVRVQLTVVLDLGVVTTQVSTLRGSLVARYV